MVCLFPERFKAMLLSTPVIFVANASMEDGAAPRTCVQDLAPCKEGADTLHSMARTFYSRVGVVCTLP